MSNTQSHNIPKSIFAQSLGSNRGSLLLAVAGATFAIFVVTVALLSITSNAVRLNGRQQQKAQAVDLAESAAERAVLALRDKAIPPLADFTPDLGAIPGGVGTWGATVISDTDNVNQFLKKYRILAYAIVGTRKRTVEIIVKQASFGKYAYFTDSETSSGGGAIWWNSSDRIDGPVHSNNSSVDGNPAHYTPFQIDYSAWSSYNRPIFLDQVTCSGPSITYTPSRPSNESTYQKVFANGSRGYTLGLQKIALPQTTDGQKQAAWGSSSGFPSTTGVYLRAASGTGGGVYIQGDAGITMSVDASGNQLMVVKQGSNTTTIKYDKAAGTTSATGPVGPGSPTTASSFSNGVIYCTGNITSLSGTIADNKYTGTTITRASSWTIATDTNASKDITITGDIVYKTKPDKTKPATDPVNLAAGTLGLVGQDIKIADAGVASPNNHPNREIDAVMIAGSSTVSGSISVNNYNDNKGKGTLTVLGGLIQSTRGIVASLSGGSVTSGYAKNYTYDPRLAVAPPPFYPTTGQYDRLSWKVVGDVKADN